MRRLALPLSLAVLACASFSCATSPRSPDESELISDDFAWFANLLAGTEKVRAKVERFTLRARGGDTSPELVANLETVERDCRSLASDVPERAKDLLGRHPGDARAREADKKAQVAAVKLREAADEAAAAARAIRNPAPAEPVVPEPPPEVADVGTAGSEPAPTPAAEADPIAAGAAQAARELAAKLKAHQARRFAVTPPTTSVGDEMPAIALAHGNKGSEADIHGRVFARALAVGLAKEGFKAGFTSNVAGQLAAAPSEPQKDVSAVVILVYGALAVNPGQFAAWDLRAVDLNDDGIVGETQGTYRAR